MLAKIELVRHLIFHEPSSNRFRAKRSRFYIQKTNVVNLMELASNLDKIHFKSPLETTILASSRHTLLCYNNTLWVFGENSFGQCGIGNTISQQKPVKLENFYNNKFGAPEPKSANDKVVLNASDILSVKCGSNHSAVLTKKGLYMFGSNEMGQLGLGDTIDRLTPVRVQIKNGSNEVLNIVEVSLGTNHTIVRTEDGSAYAFGCNKMGQLGLGDTTMRLSPVQITKIVMLENPVKKIENLTLIGSVRLVKCGGNHTFVLTTVGLFACGYNMYDSKVPIFFLISCLSHFLLKFLPTFSILIKFAPFITLLNFLFILS